MLEKPGNDAGPLFYGAESSTFKYVLDKAKEKGVELSFDDVKEIQKQVEEVKDKYFGTEKWLKSPNGQESKLTESQWLAVRTPNFKAWFGDWENNQISASKAIDTETGEPKIYYHGAGVDIEDFKSLGDLTGSEYDNCGIYFTPSLKIAEEFSLIKAQRRAGRSQSIYPVFLNFKNPKVALYTRTVNKEDKDKLLSDG